MTYGVFQRIYPADIDPTIESWLTALENARNRTRAALKGLNPEDAVVDYLREKHKLLIGEPMADRVLLELSDKSKVDRVMVVKGRSLITGRPSQVEVNSTEIQAIDNSKEAHRYLDWTTEGFGPTIGGLLYRIAANEANWLFVGLLKQPIPVEIETLFERNTAKLEAFVRSQTLAAHWKRLDRIRYEINRAYREMIFEDFRRVRRGQNTVCSAEWVIHELCQFEAECRSEIRSLLIAAREALDPGYMNDELKRLYDADVHDHSTVPPNGTLEYIAMRERDQQRRQHVRHLLDSNQVQMAADFFHAAQIFQHSDTPDDAWTAHELAMQSVQRGETRAKWLSAAAYDRWLMYSGKPQKYGTQYVSDGRRQRLWDVDPATTDDERAAWDVPPLAEQVRKAEEATRIAPPQPIGDDAPQWLKDAIQRWESEE